MTKAEQLRALADRCEAASGPGKAIDREIALAIGWVRRTPSEGGRKYPTWFHPDDCRDGQPVFDSLHGTDVWRDPIAFTAGIDNALTLMPDGWRVWALDASVVGRFMWALQGPLFTMEDPEVEGLKIRVHRNADGCSSHSANALCAAALRALAEKGEA